MTDAEYEAWAEDHTFNPARGTALVLQSDRSPAAWIEPLLVPGSFAVRMTSPQGFEAYVRIFFPFEGREPGSDDEVMLTWREVARRNGRVAHPLMEAETILEQADGDPAPFSASYSIAERQIEALIPILSRHTSSTEGCLLLWDGFGDLNARAFDYEGPKVVHDMRRYYLLRGPLSSYRELPHDPNYWWPDDRAWCFSTDVDFNWAYLAGTSACTDEILATAVLDAFETRPENPAVAGMDVVNERKPPR